MGPSMSLTTNWLDLIAKPTCQAKLVQIPAIKCEFTMLNATTNEPRTY